MTESTTRRKMVRVLSVFLSLAVSSYGFSVNRKNVQQFHHLVAPLRSSKDTDINADSSGSSPVQDEFAFQDGVRAAGMGGYSVMRQPASRTAWDPKADPEFELPVNLDEQKDAARQLDDDWWSNKFLGQPPQPPSSTTTKSSASAERQKKSKPSGTGTAIIGKEPEELDLFQRTLDTLDYPRVMQSLYDCCTTAPARTIVREASRHINTGTTTATGGNNQTIISSEKKKKRIPPRFQKAHQPLTAESVEGVQERYRAVQEMEWLLNGGYGDIDLTKYKFKNPKTGYKEDLAGRPAPLSGNAYNLDLILLAADKGRVLEGEEIFEISSMLDGMENVLHWSEGLQKVEELEFTELVQLADCITVNNTLQELLHKAFDKDGKLDGGTFPAVGRLRGRVRTLKSDIMATLDSLLTMPSIKSKLATESGGALISEVSGGRLVLPVDAKHASSVGIVHDSSRSGKTVYVEPTEIVGPTNELRQAEGELRTEEARVWRSLTEEILQNRVPLETSVKAIGQLDLVWARLLLGRKLSGTIPIVQDEGVISLRNAKHPVLLLRELPNVVGSDVELGSNGNQGLVLTGPNAGGKTVILKLLGLIALMARGGIPVPADPRIVNEYDYVDGDDDQEAYQPRVDFFNPVLADIGDLQSVGGDLSTFSGHILVCREVLANSGKNALVLMDEVGSGTDPAQGVAIAQALLEALMDTGARVAITTHYMQLKQLAVVDDRFAVGGMQFVGGRPTYKLLPGTVGESFALAVAERLELPRYVIDRATELLDSETRQMGDLLRELEEQKNIVDQQVIEMEEKRKEMAKLAIEMKEQQIKLEKKQLNARRDEARKFAEKLEEKERVLEEVLEKLKSNPSRRIVAKSWDDIKFVKRDALNEAENVPSVVARKQQAAAAAEEASGELVPIAELREKPDLKEGDTLIVCKPGPLFGREAVIIKELGSRVEVRVNNMNVGLKLKEVALPNKAFKWKPSESNTGRPKSTATAAEKAIQAEQKGGGNDWQASRRPPITVNKEAASSSAEMRTQSNTIDVRGCYFEEAKDKATEKFSTCLMGGRKVVYILHGYGTTGVLRTKIRNWLKSERQLVKSWKAAETADGGDSFSRVELR
jgi:DNA mismatch repair protein MutS2